MAWSFSIASARALTKGSVQFVCFCMLTIPLAERLPAQTRTNEAGIVILEMKGTVEVLRSGARTWDQANTNQAYQVLHAGDRVRTGERSRLTLRWSDQSIIRIGELADLQISPAPVAKARRGFSLLQGMLYFFHRDKPTDVEPKTRTASAAIRGTEFNLEVEESGRTILTMLDGEADLSNDQGSIHLTSGQQGIAEPGKFPSMTPVINTINVIQWALYYPGILDLDELPLNAAEQQVLAESLAAYRSGDLLDALAKYPAGRQPASAAERVYFGALLLAVGQVEKTGALLNSPEISGAPEGRLRVLADALLTLVAAVKLQQHPPTPSAQVSTNLATIWLAESYYQQSRADLTNALKTARNATTSSPRFGFGWARLAELEFSFGRTAEALAALDKSLELAPRNAQALALKGFLRSAENRISEAITYFERAMAIDGALGNAWLGRGLCRIRQGKAEAGREDLLVAAALEPQRALLRSYLGKAYSNVGDTHRAAREIRRAKELDEKDPTGWLYSALLNQQNNRINEAVRDLEKSQELNDNRSVYRSRLLLDQDRAVRSANLANIYQDAGMPEVSVREAARAVTYDYANYSAHLFLANSYDQLRDPKFVNLRLESSANSEYLIANLLAPVGGGTLNTAISQQEYSRLFEGNRLGVVSSTEYFSRGDWVQSGAQFGTFDNSSYSVGAFYRTENGQRPNSDLEQRQLFLQLKQQLTPKDNIYLEASHLQIEAGDLLQYYDNSLRFPELRTKELQEPILTLGYHHEWSPGQHSLVLASWLNDEFIYRNPSHPALLAIKAGNVFKSVTGLALDTNYRDRAEIFSIEPQHIWQQENHLSILGGRFQFGRFATENFQISPTDSERSFPNPPAAQDFTIDFERWSLYAYHDWQLLKSLGLIGGLVYDRLVFPENVLAPPISERKSSKNQLSPKAGLIWTPSSKSTVRFSYTRSLSGASLDQSIRIEPTQVAGLNQTFRSLIPESVEGSIPAAQFETFGLSMEQKLGTGTYLGVAAEILNSDAERTVGAFVATPPPPPPPPKPGEPPPPRPLPPPPAAPAGLAQSLGYQERSLAFTLNQLISDEWSVGARYRLARAELATDFHQISDSVSLHGFEPRQELESILHQINLFGSFNHPSGFFSLLDIAWYSQSNRGYTPDRPGDDFWQFNLFAGYRFPRRRAEIRVGLLNIIGQDYRLDPLTFDSELPRARTVTVRFRFSF